MSNVLAFEGYASTTEQPYDMGWYDETIKRGAFTKTLQGRPDVVLNIQHGAGASGLPIARTTAGTLQLREDHIGLHVAAELDGDDPDVALVARKMARGDLDGQMSFCFSCVRDRWDDDYTSREILEADISHGDVSIVAFGANPTTSSSLQQLARAARTASIADRRRMAATVAQGRVVVESRSFSLGGVSYEMRSARASTDPDDDPPPCNRCGGDGSITLQGKSVTCPQCGGDGGPSGNAAEALGRRMLSSMRRSIAQARIAIEREKGE